MCVCVCVCVFACFLNGRISLDNFVYATSFERITSCQIVTFHPRLWVSYILRSVGKLTNDRKVMRIFCDFQILMYMSDLYRPPVAYHSLLYLHNLGVTPKNLPKLKCLYLCYPSRDNVWS